MALDYVTSNTGIFFRIGKIIKYVNSRLASATTTLPAELKAIADPYEVSDFTGQISGLYADYDGFKSNVVRERQTLAAYSDNTLTDRATVLTQINVPTADVSAVLPELVRQMNTDAASVKANTSTIGTVTANAANKGNGTVLLSKLLDGYNAPLQGGIAMVDYAGLNSELACPTETMTFTCVADSARDGLTAASERFSWVGGIQGDKLDYLTEGSGTGPSLTAAGDSTIVSNANFETWTTNQPGSWTITAGVVTTNVLQMNTAANVYRGASSLQLKGDGATAAITLTQAISAGAMTARRLYNVTARVKASAASGTGALTILFTGTGYTASASEKIAITAGSMPTSFTLYNFFIVTPANLPSDWTLSISNSGTPGGTSNVYVDCVVPVECYYHGGVAAVVVPGSTPFAANDRFTVAISNDAAGTFQEFFRKWYGVQLPSNGVGAETIANSLAT
jgi:hypothetical protein